MKHASCWFTEEEAGRIEQAVAEAEKSTRGEIVPVVATASGDYDRAEDLFGLWVAAAGLVLFWWILLPNTEAGEWGTRWAMFTWVELVISLAVLVVGFLLGAALAAWVAPIRRLLCTRARMRQAVEESAARVFFQQDLRSTRERTGLLIYVSLFERMVRITGDQAVAQVLSDADWQGVRDQILEKTKTGQPAEGLIAGIRQAGELLARHFPPRSDDIDELPNRLRLID